MEVYVQSRGFSEDYDYCWLKITHNAQQRLILPILIRCKIADLIQSEAPSVVLARDSGELLLLVTAQEASEERIDFRGRKIRNSVAWVGQDFDEPVLRAIAVRALRGLLKDEIDRAVNFGGEYGFEVSLSAFSQLASMKEVGNLSANLEKKIGKSSQSLIDDLVYELQKHCLPREDGPLVVVTGIKSEAALKQAGVWRALSSQVNGSDWQKIGDSIPFTSRYKYTSDGFNELSSFGEKIPKQLHTLVTKNKLPLAALIFLLLALLKILF